MKLAAFEPSQFATGPLDFPVTLRFSRGSDARHSPRRRRRRDHAGIFLQFARNNFVQRVSGSVMIVKIEAIVLHRAEGGDACFFDWLGVGADMLGQIQSPAPISSKIFATGSNIFFTSGFALRLSPTG